MRIHWLVCILKKIFLTEIKTNIDSSFYFEDPAFIIIGCKHQNAKYLVLLGGWCTRCCGLNCVPRIHVEGLTPTVIVFEDGETNYLWSHKGGAIMVALVSL